MGKAVAYAACLPPAIALRAVPVATRVRMMTTVVSITARLLPGREALRTLLALDRMLYAVTSDIGTRYAGGMHPKHRLTRYHDFFKRHIYPGETVLDIGCGIGAVAVDIAEHFGGRVRVTGVDWEAGAIAAARTRAAGNSALEFLCWDVSRGLPPGHWDVVVLSNVLEHLEDRPTFLRQVVDGARPARVLVRVPMYERDWRVPLADEIGVDYRLDPTHVIEYTWEEFADEMTKSGLSIEALETRWGEFWVVAVPEAM